MKENVPRTGWRVALVIAITFTLLLGAFNYAMSRQGRNSFSATITAFQLGDKSVIIEGVPERGSASLQAPRAGIERLKTPQDYFNDQFRRVLLIMTLIGLLVSVLIGVFIARSFIVQPLGRLQRAIGQLKRRNFKNELEPTGVPEFDDVVADFNDLARELDRAEELRRDLISDTSHELKTPLTALQVQLEGMRDGIIPRDKERVGSLIAHVERLTDLTDRLQEYTRLRSRTASLTKHAVKLKGLVEEVLTDQVDALKSAGLVTRVDISAKAILEADRNLLNQVLTNLVANATAYAGKGTLTISYKDGVLAVADTGKGVPKEALSHLFERFYRIDRSRNRKHGGLGLGLAIVQEIVEAHGWTIQAEANTPTGLRFVIKTSSRT